MTKPGLALPNLSNAHPVYTGSNSLSPFHECYANRNTILRLAAGRFFVHYNGEALQQAYWPLRKRAALYDVTE